LVAAAGLVLILSGCAEVDRALEPAEVNPSSPIASYADRVASEPLTIPSFASVPAKPTDVRPATSYKAAVIKEVGDRRSLDAWWRDHPQLTDDTEAWAAEQRRRIPKEQADPVATSHDAESEAFAKRLRDQAVKPQ
jgi:hypothetical protein